MTRGMVTMDKMVAINMPLEARASSPPYSIVSIAALVAEGMAVVITAAPKIKGLSIT